MQTNKVFFLKDTETDEWLLSGFSKYGYPLVVIGAKSSCQYLNTSRIVRILLLHGRYIKVVYKALLQTKKNDIIICFLDVMASYLYIFSKLLGRKRYIIAVNIMYNAEKSIITRIKGCLFRLMLKSKYLYPTVTSSNLKRYYQKCFKLPEKEFYLVHDCYGKYIQLKKKYKSGNNYVFCGGTNGRDWETLVSASKLLPDIRFIVVGPSKGILGDNIPANITYFYNIEYSEFNRLMENCSLLALPLKTEAPAGLIVLLSAGLMTKAVITSDNETMREYITDNENGVLVKIGDFINLAKQIELLFYDVEKQKLFGEKLHQQVQMLSSPEVFASELIEIVNKIRSDENSFN